MTAKLCTFTLICLSLVACNKEAATPTNTTNDVATRQALMKDWRAANDIIKGMVENPDSFDKALLQEQTKFLADSHTMWAHFKDSNAKGKAQETVWSDTAGFNAAAQKFDDATTALNNAAQTATTAQDIAPFVGQVGESCGGCHKTYKQ